MSAVACIVSLIAACMCIAFGVVRIGTWLIDRREQDRARVIRDATFVAQARAELHRKEIEASKCGDLLTAASYADAQEVIS